MVLILYVLSDQQMTFAQILIAGWIEGGYKVRYSS